MKFSCNLKNTAYKNGTNPHLFIADDVTCSPSIFNSNLWNKVTNSTYIVAQTYIFVLALECADSAGITYMYIVLKSTQKDIAILPLQKNDKHRKGMDDTTSAAETEKICRALYRILEGRTRKV